MLHAIEAEIDKEGNVKLTEQIKLEKSHKALVIILDEKEDLTETAQLSESALAKDWDRVEEDDAWKAYQ